MIFTTTDALISLAPTAIWRVEKPVDGPENIVWIEGTRPSAAAIAAEITRLQADYDSKEYQRKRAAEYPSIANQMDMQYWDSVNGTTTWQTAINAVKAKYPKPEGA